MLADIVKDCNQRKDAALAIKACTKILETYKKAKGRAIALELRGNAYFTQQRYDLAHKDLTASIKLYPKLASVFFRRAMVYRQYRRSDLAIADLTRAIELKPNVAGYDHRGDMYFEEQNYKRAVADFTHVIRLEPKNARAYFDRARSYRNQRQWDKARADFKKAIALKPDFAAAKEQLAFMEHKLKQAGTVSKEPDKPKNPLSAKGNYSLHYGLGTVNHTKGNYTAAIKDFTKALEFEPKSAEAYMGRGRSYLATQQWDKAIADNTKVIRYDAGNSKAFNNLGVAHLRKKEYAKAENAFSGAIKRALKDPVVRRNRGIVYRLMGDYIRSIDDFTDAIRLEPESAGTYFNRGRSHKLNRDYDFAMSDFNAAIKLNPKLKAAIRARDQLSKEMDDMAKAGSALTKSRKKPKTPIKTPGGKPPATEVELAFWKDVGASGDPEMIQAYLDQFPDGVFAKLAKLKLKKLKNR